MAKRPPLTEDSFLRHLFSPKKNPAPTGLRARALAFTKGRKKARVNSYNRMSATSQELLKRSGLRESYLRGEASLKDARAVLRSTAVNKGIAKPSRSRTSAPVHNVTALDTAVAVHVVKVLSDAGKSVNPARIHHNVRFLPNDIKPQVPNWDVGRIKAYAGDSDNAVEIEDQRFNPLWYH